MINAVLLIVLTVALPPHTPLQTVMTLKGVQLTGLI